MDFDNPRLYLALETQGGRGGQAEVNGFPIFENFSRQTGEVRFPVSHLVEPGANTIAWRVFLDEDGIDSEARVTARLLARPRGGEKEDEVEIASISLDGPALANRTSPPGDASPIGSVGPEELRIDAEDSSFTLTRGFSIDVAFPRWRWVDSPRIEDDSATYDSLVKWYRNFMQMLDTDRRDLVRRLFTEKAEEMGKVFGLNPAQMLAEIGIVGKMNSGVWHRVEPGWDEVIVQFAMDNRLARLIGPPYGDLVAYEEEDLYEAYSIWLRFDGSNWILSR